MGTMASQITSLTIVYSTVYSSADQRTHQSFASLAFVRGVPAQMASIAENIFIWWWGTGGGGGGGGGGLLLYVHVWIDYIHEGLITANDVRRHLLRETILIKVTSDGRKTVGKRIHNMPYHAAI